MPVEKQNQAAELRATVQWYETPGATGVAPSPLFHSWLTETGLLTTRMRGLCAQRFRLEVLSASPPAPASTTRREIILWCGDQPCIYAETVIPAATSARYPWLSELGDEPLGERLSSQPDVGRTPFRFCKLPIVDVPINVAMDDDFFWARSSDFQLGNHSLTVTEAFLPGIARCDDGKFTAIR